MNLGKDQITAAIKAIPEANGQLAMIEPQFMQFLDEFLAGPSDEEGGPDEGIRQ